MLYMSNGTKYTKIANMTKRALYRFVLNHSRVTQADLKLVAFYARTGGPATARDAMANVARRLTFAA